MGANYIRNPFVGFGQGHFLEAVRLDSSLFSDRPWASQAKCRSLPLDALAVSFTELSGSSEIFESRDFMNALRLLRV